MDKRKGKRPKVPSLRGERIIHYTKDYPRFEEDPAKYWEGLSKAGALTLGVALSEPEEELILIKVNQERYPIHLISHCYNHFLLFFRNDVAVMPGFIPAAAKAEYIGPRYTKLKAWAPIPLNKDYVPHATSGYKECSFDCYKLLHDLKNNIENPFYGRKELDLARSLIGRSPIFV